MENSAVIKETLAVLKEKYNSMSCEQLLAEIEASESYEKKLTIKEAVAELRAKLAEESKEKTKDKEPLETKIVGDCLLCYGKMALPIIG